jgi:hypothetical protein
MRLLIFLSALAVVGLVVTGAIHLQKTSDHTYMIEIDKNRVQEDAERVIEKSEALLHQAEANASSDLEAPSRK